MLLRLAFVLPRPHRSPPVFHGAGTNLPAFRFIEIHKIRPGDIITPLTAIVFYLLDGRFYKSPRASLIPRGDYRGVIYSTLLFFVKFLRSLRRFFRSFSRFLRRNEPKLRNFTVATLGSFAHIHVSALDRFRCQHPPISEQFFIKKTHSTTVVYYLYNLRFLQPEVLGYIKGSTLVPLQDTASYSVDFT